MTDTNDQTDVAAPSAEMADGPVDPNEAALSEGGDAVAAVDADAAADVADAGDAGEDAGVAGDAPASSLAPGVTVPEGVELTFGGSFQVHEHRGHRLEIDKTHTSKSDRRAQIEAFEAMVDAALDGELDGED